MKFYTPLRVLQFSNVSAFFFVAVRCGADAKARDRTQDRERRGLGSLFELFSFNLGSTFHFKHFFCFFFYTHHHKWSVRQVIIIITEQRRNGATDAAGRGGVLCSSPKTDGVVLSVLNGFRQVICFHFAEQTAPRHGCFPVFSSGILFPGFHTHWECSPRASWFG